MKTIQTQNISSDFIAVDPVVLEENLKFRRLFHGQLAKGSEGHWQVRGVFTAERKGSSGWQKIEGTKISNLRAAELAKFELTTEHLKRLLVGLQVLSDAAEDKGITLRSTKLLVARKDEIVRIVEQDHKRIIEQLISQNRGREFWEALTSLAPDFARQLADASIQSRRRASLSTFESELERGEWKEPDWKKFFNANQWILGYGLRYQFLGLLQNEADYGGESYTGRGKQRGEYLLTTQGEHQRFTVTVEIKRPGSLIFDASAESRPYRSGVPGFGKEFIDAISQAQTNSRTWEQEGSRREADQEILSRQGVNTVAPRSILVFGHTDQLNSPAKTKSFELFRSRLSGTDILTYDEVLARAGFIVQEEQARSV
jgi:antiviral defense system Shedu protein SduA